MHVQPMVNSGIWYKLVHSLSAAALPTQDDIQSTTIVISNNRRILLGLLPHLSLVFSRILNEQLVALSLCWIIWVWCIQKILNAHQKLLHCNSWSPPTVLVENRQANCSRRIHVRMEKPLWKLAFWRFARVIFTKMHCQWVVATIPISLNLLWYNTVRKKIQFPKKIIKKIKNKKSMNINNLKTLQGRELYLKIYFFHIIEGKKYHKRERAHFAIFGHIIMKRGFHLSSTVILKILVPC